MTSPLPTSSPLVAESLPEMAAVEAPFSPAPIRELLRLLVKAARAHQLYLPNNPIYHSAINTLRTGFAPIWRETEEIVLTIAESEVHWYDAVVSETPAGQEKSSENLAWLFYKDGVRELRMVKGFELTELVKLLEIIQRARKGGPDEDDLVTMLWESDFTLLTYRYVDLLQEGSGGDDVADGGETQAPADSNAVRQATSEAVEESRAAGIVNMADFDTTLYLLDDKEVEYLQTEIKREYEQDLRSNVVAVLLDIFEAQSNPEIRGEALDDVHTLMVFLLTATHFRGVAYLLRETQAAMKRGADVTEEQQRKLGELADRLSSRDALNQLLQALDQAPTLPPQEELGELFDQLRPTALSTVFLWLGATQNDRLRPLLQGAAQRLAAANTAELVRLIHAPEASVATEAIRRAGALKTPAAVLPLGKILSERDVQRRQLAVAALTEIASPGALQALEKALEDTDRDVRVSAVRALTAKVHRPALPRLDAIVKGKTLRDADLTEKMAFFEGYGALCGDGGVAHLDSLLNGKGFLGRREDADLRACAAVALGRINTPRSRETLQKASSEKEIVVRNAVNKALRSGGGA